MKKNKKYLVSLVLLSTLLIMFGIFLSNRNKTSESKQLVPLNESVPLNKSPSLVGMVRGSPWSARRGFESTNADDIFYVSAEDIQAVPRVTAQSILRFAIPKNCQVGDKIENASIRLPGDAFFTSLYNEDIVVEKINVNRITLKIKVEMDDKNWFRGAFTFNR